VKLCNIIHLGPVFLRHSVEWFCDTDVERFCTPCSVDRIPC